MHNNCFSMCKLVYIIYIITLLHPIPHSIRYMVVLTLIIEGDCQLIIFTLPTLLLSFFSLPKTPDALSCLKEFFEIQVNQKCQTGNAITLILSKLGPFSKIKYVSRASQLNLREKN